MGADIEKLEALEKLEEIEAAVPLTPLQTDSHLPHATGLSVGQSTNLSYPDHPADSPEHPPPPGSGFPPCQKRSFPREFLPTPITRA